MKYEYRSVTGKYYIEVDERFNEIMMEMKKEEENADRRYGHHNPVSLESADYEGEWFSDGTDILGDLIQAESDVHFRSAIMELTPDQQELIRRVYIKSDKIVDIAHSLGVSQPAISARLMTIKNKIKKSL